MDSQHATTNQLNAIPVEHVENLVAGGFGRPFIRLLARLPEHNPILDPWRRVLHGVAPLTLLSIYLSVVIPATAETSLDRFCATQPQLSVGLMILGAGIAFGAMLGSIWMQMIPREYYVLLGASDTRRAGTRTPPEITNWRTRVVSKAGSLKAFDWLEAAGRCHDRYGYIFVACALALSLILLAFAGTNCLSR